MATMVENEPTAAAAPAVADIRVYNTLTRRKAPLEPVQPGKVGIYLCGPTVYDKAHIGHMVGPVIFDTIKRYLTYCGFDVNWVVNITDVDDKLINKANERGISMAEVADENTADYLANLAGMGVDQIDAMPKATETMDEIIAFTAQLVEQGFAYEVEGDVFFDVAKDAEYGKLTNRSVDQLEGEGGGAAAKKRSPADFALWKAAKPGEPSWDSPWGKGRPGWHIECSAMSRKLLGETFDIHGGGLDLVFPHHENEIAQSECCHGQPMANIWMHNGLLRRAAAGKVGGRAERDSETGDASSPPASEKMSRSKGAGGLAEQIQQLGGETIRFFLLRTHYRSTVLVSDEAFAEAAAALETFYRFFKRFERVTGADFYAIDAPRTRAEGNAASGDHPVLATTQELRRGFLDAMDDDFNTGGAVAELFELVRALNKYVEDEQLEAAANRDADKLDVLRQGTRTIRELSATLGLFLKPVEKAAGEEDTLVKGVIGLLIELRAAARSNKDFSTADKIRDELTALGVALEDRPDSTEWNVAAGENPLDGLMKLLIELRASARAAKDFSTADKIRDAAGSLGVAFEDRPDGTDWTRT